MLKMVNPVFAIEYAVDSIENEISRYETIM